MKILGLEVKRLLPLILISLFGGYVSAQAFEIEGNVRDTLSKQPLYGVTVKLLKGRDSVFVGGLISNETGAFRFVDVPQGFYFLELSYVGYARKRVPFMLREHKVLGTIWMQETADLLGEVKIKAELNPVRQNGDTTEFNAGAFKTTRDADVSDLLKKMPGVQIESGTVKVQGEEIKKVTVDGQEFFGDDATMVLKNLPAEIIDKVQVYDRMSEQSQLTGFDDGNSVRAINLVTKSGKNVGQFGKVYAGGGTNERYQSGFNINFFSGKRRVALIGMSNNINLQNFGTQDLLGVFNTGAGRNRPGGGRGGRMFGGGQADPSSFLVGNTNGISFTHAVGLNYNDQWGKKWKTNLTYFIHAKDNRNEVLMNRVFFEEELSDQAYNELETQRSSNTNHRFQGRFEYASDSMNTLIFIPKLTIQSNLSSQQFLGNTFNLTEVINGQESSTFSDRYTWNFSQQVLYRRRLKKQGRSISIDANFSLSDKSSRQTLFSSTRFNLGFQDSIVGLNQQSLQLDPSQQTYAQVTYTEPIGKSGQLMFTYRYTGKTDMTERMVDLYDSLSNRYGIRDTILSNEITSVFPMHVMSVFYRLRTEKSILSIGLSGQYAEVKAEQAGSYSGNTFKPFANVLPMLWGRIKFTERKTMRMMYRMNTRLPGIEQLQQVLNNSNPLVLSIGNNSLKQQIQQAFNLRYSYTNPQTQHSFFSFLNGQQTNDYIANTTFLTRGDTQLFGIRLERGVQLNRPENLKTPSRNLSWFSTYSMPIKLIKSNLNLSFNTSYSELPGKINGLENRSRNTMLQGGISLNSNIGEHLDFGLSYFHDWNRLVNTLTPSLFTFYRMHLAQARIQYILKERLTLFSDINYRQFAGLGAEYDQAVVLWNPAIAWKMGKQKLFEFRLSAYDILNQNQAISRTLTDTYLEDSRQLLLQRFYMVTITWQIRHFKMGSSEK